MTFAAYTFDGAFRGLRPTTAGMSAFQSYVNRQFTAVATSMAGLPTAAELDQVANIDDVTISNAQWARLGNLDQGVSTSDSPSFAGVSVTGSLTLTDYIVGDDDADLIGISAGTTISLGANILAYGGSHATLAGDMFFRSGTSSFMWRDHSASTTYHYGDAVFDGGVIQLDSTFDRVGVNVAPSSTFEVFSSNGVAGTFHRESTSLLGVRTVGEWKNSAASPTSTGFGLSLSYDLTANSGSDYAASKVIVEWSDAIGRSSDFVIENRQSDTLTEAFRISGSGSASFSGTVGIGEATPAADLHIKSADPTIRFEDTAGSSSIYAEISATEQGDLVFDLDPNAGGAGVPDFIVKIDGAEKAAIHTSFGVRAVGMYSGSASGGLSFGGGANNLNAGANFSIQGDSATNANDITFRSGTSGVWSWDDSADAHYWYAPAGTIKMRLTTNGLGIGVSPGVALHVAGEIKTDPVTVANLPSAATVGAGARAFVSDATATTFASVVAGTGSNNVPVYSDGTNWRIG